MAKKKTAHAYELELKKMIEVRTGKPFDPWLSPLVRRAAGYEAIIDKVEAEIMANDELVTMLIGSTGQQKSEATPLLAQVDKMHRTQQLYYDRMGLTYQTTPSKITENTKKGGAEHDRLQSLLSKLNDI